VYAGAATGADNLGAETYEDVDTAGNDGKTGADNFGAETNEVEEAGKVAAGKAWWWAGAWWTESWWTGAAVAVEMS